MVGFGWSVIKQAGVMALSTQRADGGSTGNVRRGTHALMGAGWEDEN